MHSLADVVRTHIDYTAWASQRLVRAASSLPPEELTRDFKTADHSVLGTLVHVFAADRLWLARIEGGPYPEFVTEADYNLTVLQNDWPLLYGRWKGWAAKISDQDAGAALSYSDLKGRRWTQPFWQVVLHVVNHGTHHRGQVSGFLRAMEHAPPTVDLAVYYRELMGSSH